jgi:DNA-binding transcriptional ArsR family regulator
MNQEEALENALTPESLTKEAEILKTLGNPTRLAILAYLLQGPKMVGEVMAEFQLDQALVSHHLSKLYDKYLVDRQRDGKNIYYKVRDKTGFSKLLGALFMFNKVAVQQQADLETSKPPLTVFITEGFTLENANNEELYDKLLEEVNSSNSTGKMNVLVNGKVIGTTQVINGIPGTLIY